MAINTVIFDLDGTLSDSALLTIEALKTIAPKQGLPLPSEEAIRRATGNATPEFYYILFPGFDRDLVYKAGTLVEEEELRILPALSGWLLFPGCRELLVHLKKSGISLHIASTGSREHVFSVVNATGIGAYFDSINCGRSDKTEMVGEIIKNKNEVFFVGDMKKDYEAARTNGIVSVGACYGYCVKELSGFDFYINSPLELIGMIEK